MASEGIVYVVDDDGQARRSIGALVRSMGIEAREYASAEDFLAAYVPGSPGCLVTDVRMTGMSGLELQEELKRRDIRLPAVVITAYPRTPLTVRAMKAGAVTMLDKPYESDQLWDAIRTALRQAAAVEADAAKREQVRLRIERLLPSEREVLDLLLQGKPNKTIARHLGLSVRTIESRRQKVLQKMHADSIVELVRSVTEAGLQRSVDSHLSRPS